MPFDPVLDQLLAADPTLLANLPPPPAATGPGMPQDGPVSMPSQLDGSEPSGPATGSPLIPAGLSGVRQGGSATDLGQLERLQTGKAASRYDRNLQGIQDKYDNQADQGIQARHQAGIQQKALTGRIGDFQGDRAGDLAENARKQAAAEMRMASDVKKIHDAAWTKVNEA